MTYQLIFSDRAKKSLKKVDHSIALQLSRGFSQLLAYEDPSKARKALTGPFNGLWRYRIGNWRAIVKIDNGQLLVLVVDINHRSRVYRHH